MFHLLLIMTGLIFANTDKELESFFKEKTKISNPMELRDPFKSPIIKKSRDKTTDGKASLKISEGIYSNKKSQDLSSVSTNLIKVEGVLIGKERRAIAKIQGSESVIILKEGMKIGTEGSELKAILPGGVVLVEKIINVYGQEEFLETVIPISR